MGSDEDFHSSWKTFERLSLRSLCVPDILLAFLYSLLSAAANRDDVGAQETHLRIEKIQVDIWSNQNKFKKVFVHSTFEQYCETADHQLTWVRSGVKLTINEKYFEQNVKTQVSWCISDAKMKYFLHFTSRMGCYLTAFAISSMNLSQMGLAGMINDRRLPLFSWLFMCSLGRGSKWAVASSTSI